MLRHSLTLEYESKICRQAYPPGEYMTVPPEPDVEEVNRRGDYGIEYERLAFIDGDRDPWRTTVSNCDVHTCGVADVRLQTPGADSAPKRTSTVSKPVHVILGKQARRAIMSRS